MRRLERRIGLAVALIAAVGLTTLALTHWGTGMVTARAQAELHDAWEAGQQRAEGEARSSASDVATGRADEPSATSGDSGDQLPGEDLSGDQLPGEELSGEELSGDDPESDQAGAREPATPAADEAPAEGQPYAKLWFERDGEPIVQDDPLIVVEGVSLETLQSGPGHFPNSARPGEDGNFAIAGHRTTWGAPFRHLGALRAGDTIHVVDDDGREWVYAYREQRIVEPSDVWVVNESDPVGLDAPTLTLTTCHPLNSDTERLVVWGELVDGDGLA